MVFMGSTGMTCDSQIGDSTMTIADAFAYQSCCESTGDSGEISLCPTGMTFNRDASYVDENSNETTNCGQVYDYCTTDSDQCGWNAIPEFQLQMYFSSTCCE